MARPEKTVFISYRRKDISWALAVYHYLTKHDFDVFFDYKSIPSGDFEQIIVGNIKARAHFLVILTPTALDRANEPGDWLRREIETAIGERRNIVPLFFDGFNFGAPSVSEKLSGKLARLRRYNGLEVPTGYFDEAMERLRGRYLNVTLDAVLHPISDEVQKVVKEQQVAANQAIERGEEHKQNIKLKQLGVGGFVVLALLFLIFGGNYILQNLPTSNIPSATNTPSVTFFVSPTLISTSTITVTPISMITTTLEVTPLPTSPFSVGSTMISETDGMVMVYVSAGEFRMGSYDGFTEERPRHTVYLDAFWIDQTEVTNSMYAKCVRAGNCNQPSDTTYYSDSNYANHPVVYNSWNDANDYCSWGNRRLPTEAEWEKAASWNPSEDEKYIYPWGNDFDCKKGNFDDETQLNSYTVPGGLNCDGFIRTSPVGSFPAGVSTYDAFDMAGNVWEWVTDWYSETYYQNSPSSNPLGPNLGQYRVIRGGAWNYDVAFVRTSYRGYIDPGSAGESIGFRCALSASE